MKYRKGYNLIEKKTGLNRFAYSWELFSLASGGVTDESNGFTLPKEAVRSAYDHYVAHNPGKAVETFEIFQQPDGPTIRARPLVQIEFYEQR